jgi:hypothetical protein
MNRWLLAAFALAAPFLVAGGASARLALSPGPAVRFGEARIVAGLRDWTEVSAGANGDQAFVVWTGSGEHRLTGAIYLKRIGADGTPSARVRIDDSIATSQGPTVAVTGHRVCVAWYENYGIADTPGIPRTAARLRCSRNAGATWDPIRSLDSGGGRVFVS